MVHCCRRITYDWSRWLPRDTPCIWGWAACLCCTPHTPSSLAVMQPEAKVLTNVIASISLLTLTDIERSAACCTAITPLQTCRQCRCACKGAASQGSCPLRKWLSHIRCASPFPEATMSWTLDHTADGTSHLLTPAPRALMALPVAKSRSGCQPQAVIEPVQDSAQDSQQPQRSLGQHGMPTSWNTLEGAA